LGNVWEWTEDCYSDSYKGAPTDGSAWTKGDCGRRVLRGGSWDDNPAGVRSANRIRLDTEIRSNYVGFRPARTL
jgi:formylglycine-generating enzyme required for sulfatase activity